MILEQQKQSLVLQEGEQTQESIGMSLDLDSAQILMQMLSKNLYSDSIGSTVRECASNALDSHRRAGTTDPIIVSFKRNQDNNYEFSVEDFGIGLDADDVVNIISKYGKSTKRNSNTELGMMGLGFKAPLAYSSSFYFVARKNGVERKYMMYEGEEVNTIDLLYEKPTTERNGVKVIVPVNYYNRNEFLTKIQEQLAYFEGVYFDVPDNYNIDNTHKIYRHPLFQWSTIATNDNLHICLDNVYYPIDFQKLGISTPINVGLALRFSLTDGLFPTPNRESIRYTTEAKELILKRIKEVATHIVTAYNESIIGTDDPSAILDYYSQHNRYVTLSDEIRVDARSVETLSDVAIKAPVLNGYKYITASFLNINKNFIQDEYSLMVEISYGKAYNAEKGWRSHMSIINKNSTAYVIKERFGGNVKDYLREISKRESKTFHIVKHTRKMPLKSKNKDNYMSLLSLHLIPKSEWRDAIKEYQKVVAKLNERFIPIENVVIPQAWLDARKKVKLKIGSNKRRKIEGEVVGKVLSPLERWVNGKESKLVSTNIPMENIHRSKLLTIYGSQADYAVMDKLYATINNSKVRLVVFSDRELKLLQDLDVHNWIKMEDFMKGEHKVFRRIVTAKLIYDLKMQNRSVFDSPAFLKDVSTEVSEDIEALNTYCSRNFTHAGDACYAAMLEVAKAHNYFDTNMIDTYHKMKAFLDRYTFLNTLLSTYSHRQPKIKEIVIDLLKYHGKRLNWNVYKINEGIQEVPANEETLEETI